MTFVLLPQAQQDLRELLEFIAADNLNVAHQIRKAVLQTCLLVADNPRIGPEIEGLSVLQVRRFPIIKFKRYTLFSRIRESEKEIEIIRLGYGGRDWETLLDK